MKKIAVILSGGMDSTTLAYHYKDQGLGLLISFDYGQRHRKELSFAAMTARRLGVEHIVVPMAFLGALLAGESALVTDEVEVPEGHYAAENMKATVVPNRNMIMISIAVGIAIANGCNAVAYGAHAGDHDIYPDCRKDFAFALSKAVELCDWKKMELLRPFVEMTKAQIAKHGASLGVSWEETWSCYKGGDLHCGRCGTCVERLEALAEVDDETPYADSAYWRTAVAQANPTHPSRVDGVK